MPSYQPVLAGYTLAYPTTYTRSTVVDGSADRAINGAVKLSVVGAASRKRFTLAWELITPAQAATLEDAWDALRTTSAAFTDVLGTVYTVTRDPDQDSLELDYQPIKNFTDWAVSAELTLLQVLDTD